MSSFGQALHNVITPEMAHDVIESTTFLWLTRLIDITSTTIIAFILIHYLYTLVTFERYRSMNSARQSIISLYEAIDAWKNALNTLTILFILSQFILLLILTLNIWEVIPITADCDMIVLLMVTLYHSSKSIFFCVLITRLQVAFYLSSLKYSNFTIMLLYAFVAIYTIFVCVGTPFIIFGVWLTKPINWCHIHTHDSMWASISIGVWICSDVIISIILCYLFVRPIKKVLKLTDQKQTRFTSLYVKYALLTYISIILNLVSLLLYLFNHLTILIEITAAINCICIVLMHTSYQPVFKCFCGCIVRYFTAKQNAKTTTKDKGEGIVNDHDNNTINTTETIKLTDDMSDSNRTFIGPDGLAQIATQIPSDEEESEFYESDSNITD